MMLIPTLLLLIGFIVMVSEIRTAPEGYQDAKGFHYLWRNYDPKSSDIACIWASRAEEPAASHSSSQHAAA